MIDPAIETLGPLSKAARCWVPPLRSERPVNPSTVWRWCSRGVRGTRLEFVRVGGVMMTSKEAIGRFITRLTNAAHDAPFTARHNRDHERATRELEAIGI